MFGQHIGRFNKVIALLGYDPRGGLSRKWVTETYAIRRLCVQVLIPSHFVVDLNVLGQTGSGLRGGLIGFQAHLLVFHRSPEPSNGHVIAPTALAIHADLDAVRFQEIGAWRQLL